MSTEDTQYGSYLWINASKICDDIYRHKIYRDGVHILCFSVVGWFHVLVILYQYATVLHHADRLRILTELQMQLASCLNCYSPRNINLINRPG